MLIAEDVYKRQVVDYLKSGELPLRCTHNDTKLNNVMLDDVTGEGICVIDLDPTMPGSAIYDFGDLIRTATSPAAEDEKDVSKVTMRMFMFEALEMCIRDRYGCRRRHGDAAEESVLVCDTCCSVPC